MQEALAALAAPEVIAKGVVLIGDVGLEAGAGQQQALPGQLAIGVGDAGKYVV